MGHRVQQDEVMHVPRWFPMYMYLHYIRCHMHMCTCIYGAICTCVHVYMVPYAHVYMYICTWPYNAFLHKRDNMGKLMLKENISQRLMCTFGSKMNKPSAY